MSKTLFLICPTDCIESAINKTFKGEHFFYTSLGNSFVSDDEILNDLVKLIDKHQIKNICFVLSHDNKLFLDALGHQYFSEIKGMKKYYRDVEQQSQISEEFFVTETHLFSVLSYYLNNKIKGLHSELSKFIPHSLHIRGKVYNKHTDTFKDIYSSLICLDKYYLN